MEELILVLCSSGFFRYIKGGTPVMIYVCKYVKQPEVTEKSQHFENYRLGVYVLNVSPLAIFTKGNHSF
jgi:hypothetical protein